MNEKKKTDQERDACVCSKVSYTLSSSSSSWPGFCMSEMQGRLTHGWTGWIRSLFSWQQALSDFLASDFQEPQVLGSLEEACFMIIINSSSSWWLTKEFPKIHNIFPGKKHTWVKSSDIWRFCEFSKNPQDQLLRIPVWGKWNGLNHSFRIQW